MSEPGRAGFRFSLFGVVLVFLGVLFLLHNMGVLPWSVWGTLWRFWPAIFVVIGLNILWGGRHPWLVLLASAALFGGIVIAAALIASNTPQRTTEYAQPVAGIERAEVDITHGGGELTIGSLPQSSSSFVEAAATPDLRPEFRKSGTTGKLELRVPGADPWPGGDIHLTAYFNRNVPMQMDLRTGASAARIDLTDLKVTDLKLEVGATKVDLKLPARAGSSEALIKAGAASIDVAVPQGVAARIQVTSGISSVNVGSRFPRSGGVYESPDYATAQNRIDIRLEVGVSSVTVR